MHVISKKMLREFWERHADAEDALNDWHRVAKRASWSNLVDVRQSMPATDVVDGLTVFNIRGNHYRIIARINYRSQTIFVRHVLTHAEYDRGAWKWQASA